MQRNEDGTWTWRDYTFNRLQLTSPLQGPQSSAPKKSNSEEEEEDGELELTGEWKERLLATHARLRDRRKRQRREASKQNIHEEIARLSAELQHGFDQAMERLKVQESKST